ncbi:MAG TPA: copper resistance CopC family protein [Acetobacteraceae bacterium]|nr:copper resistance CopC family protein [Acetobacteraceae bacterium]
MRPLALALVIAALSAGPAAAHAFLDHAEPKVGGVAQPGLAELDLWFTMAVVPRFSHVVVQGPNGRSLVIGALRTAQDGRELIVPVPPLAPGVYKVTWHVTAEDTHQTEGSYRFSVRG